MISPPPPSSEIRRIAFLTALVAALVFASYCWWTYGGKPGADVLPLWAAAKLWAAGMSEAIYAADTSVFTLNGPPAFGPVAEAEGYRAEIYPFIYPPIWAALMAPLTGLMDLARFDAYLTLVNASALVMGLWLIWRAAPLLPFTTYLAAGFLMLLVTTVGLLPVMGNQVQIFVAFLLALTMERSRNGGDVAAGAALGLAAALKLYPALFVVLFFATRQPRAVLAFVVVGGTLGLGSLAVAGWPLHADLLSQLRAIGRTVFQINLSMNLDALWAIVSGATGTEVAPGRIAIEKPALWSTVSRTSLIAFLALYALAGRQWPAIADHPLYWPTAILGAALLGPLSWAFHYITPIAAAPLLLALRPPRTALLVLVLVALCLSFLPLTLPFSMPFDAPPLQLLGTLALIGLFAAFLIEVLGARSAD